MKPRICYLLLPGLIVLFLGCKEQQATSYDTAEYDRQVEKYWKQAAEADRQQETAERQAKRLDALLDKWEEQAERQDRIFDMQEKQLGVQKDAQRADAADAADL